MRETYDESSWIPVYVCLDGSEFSSEVLVCGWRNLVGSHNFYERSK